MFGAKTALAVAVMAISAVTVALWIRLARARAIEDSPGARRVHARTTPRGGGIGIVAGMLATLVAAGAAMAPVSGRGGAGMLVAGLVAFAVVGFLDDLRPMGAAGKLAGQALAGGLAAMGFLVYTGEGNGLIAFALFLGWLATVNLWNFMDGSDGLVAVQSLLIALALAFWPGGAEDLRWLAAGLAASCAGFLPFNFPRASVFLGDVGSHALGALLFLLLALAWRDGVLGLAQAGLLASAFLIDGGLTLLRRAARRRPVWRAHREHLYQYAVRKGHAHSSVAGAYAAWTLGAILLAASPLAATPPRAAATLAAVLVVGGLWHGALRQHWLRRHAKEWKA